MKYSICIENLFEDIPIYDRISIAKECGADAVEIYNPALYDCKKMGKILRHYDIPLVECGLVEGWSIRLTAPIEIIKNNLFKTIALAKELGCTSFTGHVSEGDIDHIEEKRILVSNLCQLAEICEKEGVNIAIEMLNSLYDSPGYLLDTTNKAVDVLKQVGSPNIKLLYDCYHTQLMEGNLINTVKDNIEYIGHFHGSGVPKRIELFYGEVNFKSLLKAIKESGYKGWFGIEYWPSYDNAQSLIDVLAYLRTE